MKANLCFIVILLSFLTDISGQNKLTSKFEISVSFGSSIPVGSYSKKDAEYSALYSDRQVTYSIIGFEKFKSGFAKRGFDFNFEVNYKITSALRLLLRSGKFSNPVATTSMSDFITRVFNGNEVNVEEDVYKYFYVTPGIRYLFSLEKLDFGADITLGYSMSGFPNYKFVYSYTTDDPDPMFVHIGPKPNLSAFTFGSSLTTDYRILNKLKVGLSLSYQRSNFRYNLEMRGIPDGPVVRKFSDILKVRALNPELRISYSF